MSTSKSKRFNWRGTHLLPRVRVSVAFSTQGGIGKTIKMGSRVELVSNIVIKSKQWRFWEDLDVEMREQVSVGILSTMGCHFISSRRAPGWYTCQLRYFLLSVDGKELHGIAGMAMSVSHNAQTRLFIWIVPYKDKTWFFLFKVTTKSPA